MENLNIDFGAALVALKSGKRVARDGWNGKGMWLALYPGCQTVYPPDGTILFLAIGHEFRSVLPYIVMRTVQNDCVPWLASQTDVLAEDWQILES